MKPLLNVEQLSVSFYNHNSYKPVLNPLSFTINSNEIVGIVGESGSGKSVTASAIMGLLPSQAQVQGTLTFNDQNLTTLTEKQWQHIRGKSISMVFQEPMSSLNPSTTCGKQVQEILLQHTSLSKTEAQKQVIELFEKVKLPNPNQLYNRYPHEISGGQKQRVMIAMALACKPQLLIADEPTTALDVTVQKEIILLLKQIQAETQMSILFITHDLGLIAQIAQKVLVLYQGQLVEQGSVQNVFQNPQNPYTQALLEARPPLHIRLNRLPTITDILQDNFVPQTISPHQRAEAHKQLYQQTPLLEVKNVSKCYYNSKGWWGNKNTYVAVDNVSFVVYPGETVGLVGESGCGKTTLGNAILQLDKATSGEIYYKGTDITKLSKSEFKKFRKQISVIFQDPFSSLNPRISVGQAIMEPMEVHGLYSTTQQRKQQAIYLLEQVGLTPEHFNRYPHEFSGGQRQRIGIARTLALKPEIIICDESVSALDISVQAQVLNLLNDLKEQFGFTYLFISHDLAVVKYMSDKVLVMSQGKIVEQAEADTLYANPTQPYTQTLISAIPETKAL